MLKAIVSVSIVLIFQKCVSSEKTLFLLLYNATKRANPTATSVAATVMIKKTNKLPSKLRLVREKDTRATFTPFSMSSRDIKN